MVDAKPVLCRTDAIGVIAESAALVIAAARANGIGVALPDPGRTLEVMADRDLLAKIVGSMLRNAIAAIPDGGLVTTKLENSDRARVSVAVLNSETEMALITARDGYASSPGEHGFDIAMARALAQAMDGELSLDRPPGRRTRLTLHQPRC